MFLFEDVLVYHAKIGHLIIYGEGVTGFEDFMQRHHENSKVAKSPVGPAKVKRWRRVLRTM